MPFIFTSLFFLVHNSYCQTSNNFSVDNSKEILVNITINDSLIQLMDNYIVPESFILKIDGIRLKLSIDYIYDPIKNRIKIFLESLQKFFADSTATAEIKIKYKIIPFGFKSKYFHRELTYKEDTVSRKIIGTPKTSLPFTVENIFSDDLQKSGSISRGFSFGTNRDLSLNSGFRMQLSGKLSEDIDISAALTDENTPIQPEGNTQTLQEIDKVYIEMRSKNISATLGDFNYNVEGNEFGRISRKLQGGLGTAKYDFGFAKGSLALSGAVTRGKYNSNKFLGLEGVQGPYRMVGRNNERNIIIIAGSERVYIDGELMKRGEENDYIIDYAISEVTFTSRKLINGNSRIEIDFEYTDRQYARNFFAISGNANVFNDKTNITAAFYREGDDLDNPIDLSLSDADKNLLRAAGDERRKASFDGGQLVDKGKGQYIKIDTLINLKPMQIYRYAPGDSNASYTVTFTYVGEGKGDYIKHSIGHFQFVGVKIGNYMPIRFLPLPQLQTLVDLNVKSQLTEYLNISGEAAVSSLDANRFSNIDDADNKGGAYKFTMQLNPDDVKIGDMNIGSIDFKLNQRLISKDFNSIDRVNEIEFDRKWNIIQDIQDYRIDESITEGLLFYKPINAIKIETGYGKIARRDKFLSNRIEGYLSFDEQRLPKINYKVESINSNEKDEDAKGKWFRQAGNAEYTINYFTPSFKFENEKREIFSLTKDSLKNSSFSFYELSPKLLISKIFNSTISAEFRWRIDEAFHQKKLLKESNTFTQIYSLNTRPFTNLSSNFDITLRKRGYTSEFKILSGGNNETILIRWLTRYFALNRGLESDLFYDVSTQRSAKLERIFQRVPKGTGSYTYIGDVDSNGIATEDEFRPVRFDGDYILLTIPSDKLAPVIDLKFNTRFKITPSRFVSQSSLIGKLISAVSAETNIRIEEKSSEPNQQKIYFLNFKHFMNESTTIYGTRSIIQDLFLFEQNSSFSIRMRFLQRNGLTQYAIGTERNYNRERSVRVRWQLVKEIANQTDIENKRDQVSSSKESYRQRNINGNSFLSDWTYKPSGSIEFGFKFGVGRFENSLLNIKTTADINLQGFRILYSIKENGLGRLEFNREEVLLIGNRNNVPFELTGGRLEGKTWLGKLGIEYRFTNFMQASITYEARKESRLKVVHTFRGEVRAFF